MNAQSIRSLIDSQRAYFHTGATREPEFRRAQLLRLRDAVKRDEAKIIAALRADMGKPELESYVGELAFIYEEIRFANRRMKKWMKPIRVPTPWVQAISTSRIYHEPLGVTLIIGPWNYPFQ